MQESTKHDIVIHIPFFDMMKNNLKRVAFLSDVCFAPHEFIYMLLQKDALHHITSSQSLLHG